MRGLPDVLAQHGAGREMIDRALEVADTFDFRDGKHLNVELSEGENVVYRTADTDEQVARGGFTGDGLETRAGHAVRDDWSETRARTGELQVKPGMLVLTGFAAPQRNVDGTVLHGGAQQNVPLTPNALNPLRYWDTEAARR